MKILQGLIGLLFSLLAMNVMAETSEEKEYVRVIEKEEKRESEVDFVLSARFGWDWAKVGKSQHVKLLDFDPAPDYFKTDNEWSTRPFIGGFLGLEFPIVNQYNLWQTGFSFYQTRVFSTSGVDYFLSEPDFGDREYHYSIRNQRVMFENKWLHQIHKRVYVYLLGGIGAAFNKAYNYHEVSLEPHTPADGIFSEHTKTSFTYSIGLGTEVAFTKHIRAGLGYQFSDLGKVSLGDYNNGNTDDTITTSNTSTNELVMQLSYIF